MDYKEYFEQKGICLNRLKIIGFKRFNIPPEIINTGAKILYDKIIDGLKIKDIALAPRIFAEARPLSATGSPLSLGKLWAEVERIKKRLDNDSVEISLIKERLDNDSIEIGLIKKRLSETLWDTFKREHPSLFGKVEDIKTWHCISLF